MIFTVGYQRLGSPQKIAELARRLDAIVLDLRAVPKSRIRGFSRRALQDLLGDRYEWAGDKLGGPKFTGRPIVLRTLMDLRDRGDRENLLLMCMEEAPGDCHRHHNIGRYLGPRGDAFHVFRDEVIAASELQRSIDDGDDYVCEPLDVFLSALNS